MGWTFFYMFVILKIPVIALLTLVWWAVRATPEPAGDEEREDGGGPRRDHPRPRRPRPPRRGPHAGPPPHAPRRVRVRARRSPSTR